jgi:hypothetical protein
MPGLLDALDELFAASEVTASVNLQLGPLTEVRDAVEALVAGPEVLANLEEAVGALPTPPALDALGALPGLVGGLVAGFDLDLAAPLAPLLEPLAAIGSPDADVRAVARISATVDCIRGILALIGQPGGGPNGLPLPLEVFGALRDMPAGAPPAELSPADLEERIAEFEASLAAVGPRLDADRLVELLRRAAPHWGGMRKYPVIPVVSDVLQVAGVAVQWSGMMGAALTAHLDGQLRLLREVVARPRTRVVDPLLAQASSATAAPAAIREAAAAAPALLARVAAKVTDRDAPPNATDRAALEPHVVALEAAADALTLPGRPLGTLDRLVPDLEVQLIRAVRTVHPALDAGFVTSQVDQLLAAIPESVPEPFAEAVQAVEALDLSLLTDPVAAMRAAVESAVAAATRALDDVEQRFRGLLEPVAGALDDAVRSASLGAARDALAALPGQLTTFVDTEVRPAVEPIRTAVQEAVTALTTAAAEFDPHALVQPLTDAIQRLSDLVGGEDVTAVVTEVDAALRAAVEAAEQVDVAGAADEAIALLEEVRAKLAAIDPVELPEPAVPLVRQAVEAVADVDFTAEVAGPILNEVAAAVESGPVALLGELQGEADQLRSSLEQFRPSVAVGSALDAPFAALLGTLADFRPGALLERIAAALRGVAGRVQVADPAALIGPLTGLHAQLVTAAERARPSALMRPVDDAVAAAVARLFEATGADAALDGLSAVVDTAREWVDLADRMRRVLTGIADLLREPGDPAAALDALVDGLVEPLADVDLQVLAPRFAALAEAAASIEKDVVAAELTRTLRTVSAAVPPALASPELRRLVEAARAFPLARLEAGREVPRRTAYAGLVRRLLLACDRLDSAAGPWARLTAEVAERAPRLEADLTTYGRLSVIDGEQVFADCMVAPDHAGLAAAVRAAARESLELPVTALLGLFARLAPHVVAVADGLADLIAAVHTRLDELTGEQGVGGLAAAIEEAADLLRNLDLSPLTDPLDEIWARVEGAVAALDPAPLGAALQAAADAVAGLLDLSTFVPDDQVVALDQAYADAVGGMRALQPSAVLAPLDAEYDRLLEPMLALLELPTRLRELVATIDAGLSDEITAQLARVEVAFDAMLRALPLEAFPAAATAEVDVGTAAGGRG